MFEKHNEPLASLATFFFRLFCSSIMGISLIFTWLFIGMLGYHWLEGLSWIDAFLNASMILSSMGPVTPLTSTSAKLFAGFYAMFSGLFFLTIVAVILAPIVHRFLHQFYSPRSGRSK